MVIVLAALVSIGVIAFLLFIRPKDLPAPVPASPFAHLDERKAAIYENLRDLQFEYRVGKLSDQDYQQTKLDLQRELAGVLAEADRLGQTIQPEPVPLADRKKAGKPAAIICEACGAEFEQALKFCGECGKPMRVRA